MDIQDQQKGETAYGWLRSIDKETLVTAFIAIVGFAFFLSASWTARNENALVSDWSLYAARFSKVAGCFIVGWLFRNRIPQVDKLLRAGVILVAANLILYGLTMGTALGDSDALRAVSGVVAGFGEAIVILLFAHLTATFSPRLSAVMLALVFLLNELLYFTTLFYPVAAIVVVRPIRKLIGLGFLAWCMRRKRRVERTGANQGEYPMQLGVTPADDVRGCGMLGFLTTRQEWALILTGAVLFPLVFGMIAQICSSFNTNSGLYDVVSELVAIALLVALVFFALERGDRFTFEQVLYLTYPLFATGCLFLPVLWNGHEVTTAAGALVKLGYTLFQVLFWCLLARRSHEEIHRTYLYFGVFYGTFELMTAAARLTASRLYNANVVDFGFIAIFAAVALWLIAMQGLSFFAITKAWERKLEAKAPEDTYADRIEAFCAEYKLTPRERDVLLEAIHGYSMDNIGKKLYVSRETVKTHMRRIYQKAGVAGKQELLKAIEEYGRH